MSSPQRGTTGGYCRPDAAQCTTIEPGSRGTTPSSRTISPAATCLMCPRRTTCSMVRSTSSSQTARVGVFAIVGTTSVSIRSITPAASRRRNRSSSDSASAAAAMVSAASPRATVGSGWTTARLSIQGSRGRIHSIRSGCHTVREQPHDPVGRGLSGSDDHVAARRLGQPGELVDGHDVDAGGHAERRRCRRRDRRRQVGGIDDAVSNLDVRWSRPTPET